MTLGILATAVAALIAVGVVLALSSGASRTVPATKTSTAARSLTAPASKPATTPPSQPSTSDTTRPTIIISSPTHTTYRPKQRVIAQFECSDTGGSGLSSCMGSVENGSLLDTSPGVHSFSVTAKDQAGNSAERTVTYSVEQLSETSTQPTPTTSTSPPGLLLSPQKALATPPPSAQPPPPPPK